MVNRSNNSHDHLGSKEKGGVSWAWEDPGFITSTIMNNTIWRLPTEFSVKFWKLKDVFLTDFKFLNYLGSISVIHPLHSDKAYVSLGSHKLKLLQHLSSITEKNLKSQQLYMPPLGSNGFFLRFLMLLFSCFGWQRWLMEVSITTAQEQRVGTEGCRPLGPNQCFRNQKQITS